MKLNGVRRARLADGTELEFARDVVFAPAAGVEVTRKSTEETARETHERRRKKLGRELGFVPNDDQMKALP